MHFEELKKHLSRKKDKVVIEEENNWRIKFTVSNPAFEKFFSVCYLDSFSPDIPGTRNLRRERPRYKYYWMLFEQENYPQQGRFFTISDTSWYANEEEVIDAVKRFCRNWRR